MDYSLLLLKFEALSLSQDTVRWFHSYLSDRQQLVDVSGTFFSCADSDTDYLNFRTPFTFNLRQ